MSFLFSIPTTHGSEDITLNTGSSVIFVGANGGGKTRLAVYLENALGLNAHRISGHRALNLTPDVPKISEKQARRGLQTGTTDESAQLAYRLSARWGSNAVVSMLNDFSLLIQLLFAEQSNIAMDYHVQSDPSAHNPAGKYKYTKLQLLNEIWCRLLPHRELHITGDDILVSVAGSAVKYKASEMSDGERAIFYMIGQVLVAEENIVLIFDEPELHVHRSIMSKLWDELEAARPDCAFILITHDLEFAAARSAQKFVIQDYAPEPRWTMHVVPESSGFDEELTTLILGSRRPVLFVEGDHTSLDMAIYRSCYPEWTVLPRGSCTEVIHSVVSMRKNTELTRITCSGIVDADDYQEDDRVELKRLGIEILPVSEIENLFLLPDVSSAIAATEHYKGDELSRVLLKLSKEIFKTIDSPTKIEEIVVRYCRRRVDRALKKIDLGTATTVHELEKEYRKNTEALNIIVISDFVTRRINEAITTENLPQLLSYYDNKGLLALASQNLKSCGKDQFKSWLVRSLRNNKAPLLVAALTKHLPKIVAV